MSDAASQCSIVNDLELRKAQPPQNGLADAGDVPGGAVQNEEEDRGDGFFGTQAQKPAERCVPNVNCYQSMINEERGNGRFRTFTIRPTISSLPDVISYYIIVFHHASSSWAEDLAT